MKKRILSILFALLLIMLPSNKAFASSPTDLIHNYVIMADINDDATVNLYYHLEWEVLESDGIGPVGWVTVGIPNSHYVFYEPMSENISGISYDGSGNIRIDFDRDYYEGEIISFDFLVVQDYLYEMNVLTEGETVYYLTPGWFDEIEVENIQITWATDKALSWSHGALQNDDSITWSGSLAPGEVFNEISVTYPSDAFNFDTSKSADYGTYDDYDYYDDSYYGYEDDSDDTIIGIVFLVIIGIFGGVAKISKNYSNGSGFGSGAKTTTKKKITRTLIKYYPTCPGCGAARAEGQEKCEYCGRSFIESEEVVEEKDIEEPSKYNEEGTYKYSSSPNTYVRVHVTHVHVPVPRSSCAHSSCAHSSCACAHSCACACACACAGGGRAGCSVKDFYNTRLKLSQLKRKAK